MLSAQAMQYPNVYRRTYINARRSFPTLLPPCRELKEGDDVLSWHSSTGRYSRGQGGTQYRVNTGRRTATMCKSRGSRWNTVQSSALSAAHTWLVSINYLVESRQGVPAELELEEEGERRRSWADGG